MFLSLIFCLISSSLKKHILYDLNPSKSIETYFMAQNMVLLITVPRIPENVLLLGSVLINEAKLVKSVIQVFCSLNFFLSTCSIDY